MRRPGSLAALLALVLLVAACSASPDRQSEGPLVAGACTTEDPDCEDTISGDVDLPTDDETGGTTVPVGTGGGMVAGNGLSVPEALETNSDGVIAVTGFVVIDASGSYLCELLAESFPPQCGGARIPIVGPADLIDPDDLHTSQGVTWSDRSVTLFGVVVNGDLVLDPLSS